MHAARGGHDEHDVGDEPRCALRATASDESDESDECPTSSTIATNPTWATNPDAHCAPTTEMLK